MQAEGGSDKPGPVHTERDIACCAEKFPALVRRAGSARFLADDRISLLAPTLRDGFIRVVDERHHRLVPADQIAPAELASCETRKPQVAPGDAAPAEVNAPWCGSQRRCRVRT